MKHKKSIVITGSIVAVAAAIITTVEQSPSGPPIPRPTRPKWLVPRTNDFKAAAIPQLVIIKWNYGTNVTSNYWWDLQVSTDLGSWSTLVSNAGPGDVTVTNDGRRRFFRMRGRP